MTTPLFTPRPDGSASTIERLEWQTDLQISRDGTEFARQVRLLPRHRIEFSTLIESDEDKASLAVLQAGGRVLLPLWCHTERRRYLSQWQNLDIPSRGYGFSTGGEGHFCTLTNGALSLFNGGLFDGYIIPAAVARMDTNVQLTRLTSMTVVARLGFRLLDFNEQISAEVPLVLPVRHDWSVSVDDATDEAIEAFDTATALVLERHYAKRTIRISVMADSFEGVAELRRFFFAVRGRFNTFQFALTGEDASQWRMAADAVEIEYLTTSLARVQLTLVQQ